MNNIIDKPRDLMKLPSHELDELLLEKYNNTALLRELIRRCLIALDEQVNVSEYYRELASGKQERLNKINDKATDIKSIFYED